MKLKEQFITHDIDNVQMMVNSSNKNDEFHGLVKSNETAAFIIRLLKKEISFDHLVGSLLNVYDIDEEQAIEAVNYVINKLKAINALELN